MIKLTIIICIVILAYLKTFLSKSLDITTDAEKHLGQTFKVVEQKKADKKTVKQNKKEQKCAKRTETTAETTAPATERQPDPAETSESATSTIRPPGAPYSALC